jgi:DNA-binding NtrC family response regulator
MLRHKGYAICCVDTPERALAALRETPDGGTPPIALIEARLGGVACGVDLIPRLRAEQPDLICVLMTADLDSQTAIAALRRGAYDFFDKSRDPNALFAVLDRCFDRVAVQLSARRHTNRCASPRRRPKRRTAPSRVFSRR